MSVVGLPRVTEAAYRVADRSEKEEACRFAEATVFNGLGPYHDLTGAATLKLKAQIERDFLVHIVPYERIRSFIAENEDRS